MRAVGEPRRRTVSCTRRGRSGGARCSATKILGQPLALFSEVLEQCPMHDGILLRASVKLLVHPLLGLPSSMTVAAMTAASVGAASIAELRE